MASQEITLIPISSNLTLRTNFVLFPIDSIDLITALAQRGFAPAPQRRNIPEAPFGTTFDLSGVIARRGGVSIGLDGNVQLLNASGSNPSEVASAFNDLINIVRQNLGINPDTNLRFYECTSTIYAQSGNNPLQNLNNIGSGETLSRFGTILNLDVRTYSLHIGSPSDTVNRPDWFDMNIHPVSNKSNSTYGILTVFRRSVMDEVMEFLSHIEERVREIIRTIENR
jgi:hypothetical protein